MYTSKLISKTRVVNYNQYSNVRANVRALCIFGGDPVVYSERIGYRKIGVNGR